MANRKARKPMPTARGRGRVPQQAPVTAPPAPVARTTPIYDQLVKELGEPSGQQKV